MNLAILQTLAVFFIAIDSRAAAFTNLPRWGQATAIIYDTLFVQGGLTDQFNSQSYTSATRNNDLLSLSLSGSFDPSNPPWQLISSSTNSSTSQGPPVGWHTLSATNTSELLLFGGLPAINSPTVLTVRADSAWLLNVFNRLVPAWIQEAMSWANEPIRRMRHTAVTSIKGLVFLIGGEKADGSGSIFSDHYVFDPNGPSFNQLPTTNAPGQITGHGSIILPNGTMLIFGGYDGSSLVSLSKIWALDTTASSFEWITISVEGTPPGGRRAFAAVLIEGGKILIQGGCDAQFQTTYSDGWVLDLSSNPPTWSQVSALSQVGQRKDHFAVSYGSEVIFGFGYGASGPAPTPLVVFNPSDGSFPSSYSPPPSTASITQTLPGPTQTSGSGSGSGSGGQSGSGGTNGVHPTSTSDPQNPSSTDGGSPANNNNGNDNKKTTGIAVGTALGILGLIVGAVIVVYYVRRRRMNSAEESRFMLLNEDDPEAGIPGVRATGEKGANGQRWNVLKNLRVGGALTAVPGGVVGLTETRRTANRRDMLADEDTRDFGPWYARRKRDGTGDSSWSLMSFMRLRGREGSTGSYASLSSPWRDKTDPFSDGAALMADEETGFMGAAARGQGGYISRPSQHPRGLSYASTLSATSYQDPFDDRYADANDITEVSNIATSNARRPYPQPAQPLQVQTMLPIEVHTLSPVTEASRGTLSQTSHTGTGSNSSHSHEQGLSPFNTISQVTSRTSFSPRPSSLLDASAPQQPVRRSDSWWSRFSRSSILDRRGSGSRPVGGMPEIRDPNPPPRLGGLVAIEESQNSGSPEHESPNSQKSNSIKRALARGQSRVYKGIHGKSLSSLRTQDSDAIERMAGAVDVVQRERTGSHGTRDSTRTSVASGDWIPEDGRGVVPDVPSRVSVLSPADMAPGESLAFPAPSPVTSKNSSPAVTPPAASTPHSMSSMSLDSADSGGRLVRPPSGPTVAARVRDFERRASRDQFVPEPTNTRSHEEVSRKKSHVNYGLVARPSLYVANPDRRKGSSQDSQT